MNGLIKPSKRRVLFTRRSLLAAPALLVPARSKAAFGIFQTANNLATFPGQANNPVGFSATPAAAPTPWPGGGGGVAFPSGAAWPGAYPGSLTSSSAGSFTGGTVGAPAVYSFLDINHQAGGISIGANTVFVGCRFSLQETSNATNYQMISGSGLQNVFFFYCTFSPLPSLYTAPPNAAWPSAGTGTPYYSSSSQWAASYAIANTASYQYIVNDPSPGPITWDHCDIWGCGNPIAFANTTAQMTCQDCWFHDYAIADYTGAVFHHDGPGYLDGTTPTQNAKLLHCTIASIGNTRGVSWQFGTSAYANITVDGCYLSGFNGTVAMGDASRTPVSSGMVFTNNIVSTDINWANGFLDTNYTTWFNKTNHPTNVWSNNKLLIVPGSSTWAQWTATFGANAGPDWTGKNGYYLWADTTLNVGDWPN